MNNRLDDEEPGQPASAEIAAAAADAGLRYVHLPVGAGLGPDLIAAARDVLAQAEGGVLFHCKSGFRSALLWAAAAVAGGAEPDAAISAAAGAGFDLRPHAPTLARVAAAFRPG